jgi:preprotein translocase subunit SecA
MKTFERGFFIYVNLSFIGCVVHYVHMKFLKKLFKEEGEKLVEQYSKRLDDIKAFEEGLHAMDDENLRAQTDKLKGLYKEGKTLDELLPEAFATVREVAMRTTGLRHYDVQMIGGMTIDGGNIAEMRTGEGKTLVATLPVYLNALTEEGVHLITVNDYLARRDAVWMGQIYASLGMTIGVINQGETYLYDAGHQEVDEERDAEGSYKVFYEFLKPCTRREAYEADVTYGTNSEFGFDYLRDNLETKPEHMRQRELSVALVDEIDSILIDEARTPLIISGAPTDSADLYKSFARIARTLEKDTDYTVDEKLHSVSLVDSGIEKAEKALKIDNMYTEGGMKYVHHLEKAVQAEGLYARDREYVIREGSVVIVDESTGRLQPGRRWSDGLHQAIEAKEGVKIGQETRTVASITYQNYFKLYKKLSGMTGTAFTSKEEFLKVYGLDVVSIPTHQDIKRLDYNDLIFQTTQGKHIALAKKVKEYNKKGQPVLIGTVAIEDNEKLSQFLTKEGVKHEVLNAKNHEREGEIIADAGKRGAVTIATNMAGRGVDIKLGGPGATAEEEQAIKDFGGLAVIGTERHDSRRVDNQLRGRSGRQGDPGETQFFVSMEDKLMRIFASSPVKAMMAKLGLAEDEAIENKMITKSLENAQTRIEGMNFDARKTILEYDSVINRQRLGVYARRKTVLLGTQEEIDSLVNELFLEDTDLQGKLSAQKEELGEEQYYAYLKRILLHHTDVLWVEHLETMDYTRASVALRGVGQRDPMIEYKKEGKRLFEEMNEAYKSRVYESLEAFGQPEFLAKEKAHQKSVDAAKRATGEKSQPVVAQKTYERNDKVIVVKGSERQEVKYKKALQMLAEGWHIAEKR